MWRVRRDFEEDDVVKHLNEWDVFLVLIFLLFLWLLLHLLKNNNLIDHKKKTKCSWIFQKECEECLFSLVPFHIVCSSYLTRGTNFVLSRIPLHLCSFLCRLLQITEQYHDKQRGHLNTLSSEKQSRIRKRKIGNKKAYLYLEFGREQMTQILSLFFSFDVDVMSWKGCKRSTLKREKWEESEDKKDWLLVIHQTWLQAIKQSIWTSILMRFQKPQVLPTNWFHLTWNRHLLAGKMNDSKIFVHYHLF